jgi:predicted transcriptional regulator
LSPRAAARLESLGFARVYEYRPGKADWTGAGLPTEGKLAAVPRIGQLARKDVVRARLGERVSDVAERARSAGWDTALVVNGKDILVGRLFQSELEGDPGSTVDAVMQHGPSTFRPDVDVIYMTKFMEENDLETVPVTTSDGVVIGLALKEDLEKLANDLPAEGTAE